MSITETVNENGESTASVLADIINRCYRMVDRAMYGPDFSETMTLTFGEQSVVCRFMGPVYSHMASHQPNSGKHRAYFTNMGQ